MEKSFFLRTHVIVQKRQRTAKHSAKTLLPLLTYFVNDAFGTAHRAHCSNVGVTEFVDTCAVGYLMQKEIDFLGNAVETPVRPFVAILGGAKVADKLNVISNLLEKCDTLIIGGGMAYTFLKAKGLEVRASLVDDTKLDYCKEMLAKAESLGKQLLLPRYGAIAKSFPNPIDAEIDIDYVIAMRSRQTYLVLTSDLSPAAFTPKLLKQRKLLYGTDRWAYLRTRFLQKERSL